jgi:hypothetical protein
MCSHCDEALYRYLHEDTDSGWHHLAPLALVFGTVALALVTASLVPVLAPIPIVCTLMAIPVYAVWRKRRRRARFFRIMRERGELPPPPADESPEEEALAAYLQSRSLDRIEAGVEAPPPVSKPGDVPPV